MKRQRGQVLPIFAVAAIVIVGIAALAIDYAFLSDQHRNLQAAVDAAAEAGARQITLAPTPTDRTAARTAAFIYLRDNLQMSGVTTANAKCSGVLIDFTQDFQNCDLGNGYTLSIVTPGQHLKVMTLQTSWTITVTVSEVVSSALAGFLGSPANQAVASATAIYNHAQNFTFAGYTQGCLSTGSHLEIIGGQLGIDGGPNSSCTPSATLCVRGSPGAAGAITFGPNTKDPLTLLQHSTTATCTAGTSGQVLATDAILHAPVTPPPGLAAPPAISGSTTFPLPDPCFYSETCTTSGAATATCTNGSNANPLGQKCFQPGTYAQLGPVANNLNPGVYYIAGPNIQTSGDACYNSGSTTPCKGIWFTGNTVNANWQDVSHQCWKAPNSADAWTYASTNCPTSPALPAGWVDGFVFDPTTPADPMCPYYAGLSAPAPPFVTVTANATGGTLASGQYWVRVTATNAIGETTSTLFNPTVTSPLNQGSLTVTGSPMPGAQSYVVYGPAGPTAGPEPALLRYGSMSATVAATMTLTGPPTAYQSTNTAQLGVVAPAFSLASSPGGSLPAGQALNLRVSAVTALGETDTNLRTITIPGASTNRSVTLSITSQSAATGYRVYGPSLADGNEAFYGSITGSGFPGTVTYTVNLIPSATSAWPTNNSTSNAELPDPTFTLTPVNGASGSLGTGTYYVKVTAVNALGQTLGTELTAAVAGNPVNNAISVQINRVNGATGYNIYGPNGSSGGELGAPTFVAQPASGNPGAVELDSIGSGSPPPVLVNTTGCPTAGFHNLPTSPTQNYGVTIVLGGRASFCLNTDCNSAGSPPVVMLSPACYSGWVHDLSEDRYKCNAPPSGPLQDDGAFPIYGTTTGVIEGQGSGGPWTMTGSLYTPNASLVVGPPNPCTGAGQLKFGMIPGQFISNTGSFCTGNANSPLAWWIGGNGAELPTTVGLIQ